jgi:hypothetical protein
MLKAAARFTTTRAPSQSMPPDAVTDWAGADKALAELGEISPSPPPELYCEDLHSVASLTAEKGTGADLARFKRAVIGMPDQDTQTLILRLETQTDPLILWELHQELDRRDIPPAQRWPANQDTPQAAFITLLADLLWITRRHPCHTPDYRGWRGLFSHPPGSPGWHATAYRQYLFVSTRYSVSHWCSKGLALTDLQRLGLMVLQTRAMQADRRQLDSDKFSEFRADLLAHAIQNLDKAGKHTPEAIAERRARLWRIFVLSGRNQTTTAKNWHLLTGEALTRQAIAKQLAIVDQVKRERARTA